MKPFKPINNINKKHNYAKFTEFYSLIFLFLLVLILINSLSLVSASLPILNTKNCNNDSQCDDKNSSTEDKCINRGTPQSYCTHVLPCYDISPDNGLIFTVGANVEPNAIYNFVKSKYLSIGSCPLPGKGNAMFLAEVPWTTGLCPQFNKSKLHATAKKICNLAGYRDVYSFDSYYKKDGGRCNYFTPADDCLWYWNGTTFKYMNGNPKFEKRWITSLKCINKIPEDKCNKRCSKNSDCNDNNPYTYDECVDSGTPESRCKYYAVDCVNNNDCGFSGFFGNEFCLFNDVFKNFQEAKCINSGTPKSYCDISIIPTPVVDCGESECSGNYGDRYCKEGNVYISSLCENKGCEYGKCFNKYKEEETLLETCLYGCSSGWCNSECINDSGCQDGKKCKEGKCVIPYCNKDSDCREGEFCEFEKGKCSGQGTCTKKTETCTAVYNPVCGCDRITHSNDCVMRNKGISELHEGECLKINCSYNSDCGIDKFLNQPYCKGNKVYDSFTKHSCQNPGMKESYCTSSNEEKLIENCAINQLCSDGKCRDIACKANSDCNDNNPKTEDICLSPNTLDSKCIHNTITCSADSDCGINGFIDNQFCQNNNVFQNYLTYTCRFPGIGNSSCSKSIMPKLKIKCSNNQACSDGQCANVTCFSNSDCGADGFLNQRFCKNENIFDKFITYTCNAPGTLQSLCINSTEEKLIENCANGCNNALCVVSECTIDSDCQDSYSDNYCKSDDVYRDFNDFKCENNKCIKSVAAKLVKKCKYDCDRGKCERVGGTSGGSKDYYENNIESDRPVIEEIFSPSIYAFSKPTSYENQTVNESIQNIDSKDIKVNFFDRAYLLLFSIFILLALLIILTIIISGHRKRIR